MDAIANQVVMISGGSEGIGYAVAERFGKQGAKISICARSEEKLREAAYKLENQSIDCLAVQADVSNEADVENWFKLTEQKYGPALILVNNAGVSGVSPVLDLSEDQWDHTMSVNVRGVFLCCKRALPAMMEKKDGRIVMISSIASQYFRPNHSLYFASKWALNGFSSSLAQEVSEHGIRVKIICPGMTETNFFDEMGGRPHEDQVPYVTPEHIADQVEHACLEPDGAESMKRAIFPAWQVPRQHKRR